MSKEYFYEYKCGCIQPKPPEETLRRLILFIYKASRTFSFCLGDIWVTKGIKNAKFEIILMATNPFIYKDS